MGDDVMLSKLMDFFNSNTFVHISTKGFHYNGLLVLVDEFYVEINDFKTDSNVLIKIDSIDLLEEGRK
jgi:hypothetical protein